MKWIKLLGLCLLTGACAYRNPMSDMAFQTTMAPPYVVANWYKITEPNRPLKVYIEGDGYAFDAEGQPTDNPTPKSTFMRELAAGDPSPNVAYVARPCQFLQPACRQEDWTIGRFSEKIISSMDSVIAGLMKKAQTDRVILIGFSGGAQVAGLVAARHPERVKHLITIAGVLDHAAWTSYHRDPPLDRSLNLSRWQQVLKSVPQTNYVGERDTVVPPALVQQVADPETVIVVPRAEHGAGFSKIYSQIYEVR